MTNSIVLSSLEINPESFESCTPAASLKSSYHGIIIRRVFTIHAQKEKYASEENRYRLAEKALRVCLVDNYVPFVPASARANRNKHFHGNRTHCVRSLLCRSKEEVTFRAGKAGSSVARR